MKTINKKQIHFPLSLALVLALILFFYFILPLVTCPLWGQVVQKKQLMASDYDLFGEFQFHGATADGHWSSFSMSYHNASDTLFLQHTSGKKQYDFPKGSKGLFLGNNHFACQTPKGLQLINLQTDQKQTIASVRHYQYSADSSQLVMLIDSAGSAKQLLIMNLKGKITNKIQQVKQFSLSPDGRALLYIVQRDQYYSLGIQALDKPYKEQWIMEKSLGDFKMLIWEKTGKSFAFLNANAPRADKSMLYYYMLDTNFLYRLDPEKQSGFPSSMAIDSAGKFAITISEDLSRVFFTIRPKTVAHQNNSASDSESQVEIWNGNAKWIYPMEKRKGNSKNKGILACWSPFTRAFSTLTSPELSQVMIAGQGQYAILSDPKSYEPQYNTQAPRDFYIMDLQTSKKELFLEKHPALNFNEVPTCSPQGGYITYFREDNWWLYDLHLKKHINLTSKINTSFIGKANQGQKDSPYGLGGWTPNEKELILYDQYDLWIVKADGSDFRRITHGREKQICFRISTNSFAEKLQSNYDGWTSQIIPTANGLLLQGKGIDGKTGYFSWKNTKAETPIVYKDAYVDKLLVVDNGKSFIYQEQQFNEPPRLVLGKGKTAHVFFQSNPQQAKYKWGFSELLSYSNSKGEKWPAVLYYPADFDPQKKYPMVVHIYEKQSTELHKYFNPSLRSEDGYNPTVLTSLGYFVLCPDIIRQDGQEGQSALDFTLSATREIISRGLVDPSKIGLMGHSFGGFQTNYIIGHTGMFAAAVAGSAVSNLTSYYLSVNWKTGFPSMNAFQSGQLRMIKSPFEIPQQYALNSPITSSDKITTPLLSFTGKEDYHVNWHQSVELYLELRRLNKKHIMLIYPNEEHSLFDPVNQQDLSNRIYQWFGYYLKNEVPSPWIKEGIK